MTSSENDLDAVDVAVLVATAVEKVGGAYFIGGSLASSMQGEPRATNDIDIVLELPLGRIREFVGALGSDFEGALVNRPPAIRRARVLRCGTHG